MNINIWNDNIELARSITLKLNGEGVSINQQLLKKFRFETPPTNENKDTWKYYKNLMGDYHITDNQYYADGITLTSDDTGETFTLTKTTIEEHPLTRNKLMDMDVEYYDLIKKYPMSSILIKAIIFGYNNKLKPELLPDGSIVSYNHNLVDSNEFGIIEYIEKKIKLHLLKYHSESYVYTEELYPAALNISLLTVILSSIHNYRIESEGTSRARNVYMNHRFDSNLNVTSYASLLNPIDRYWLYRNIKSLSRTPGTQNTIHQLYLNSFKKLGVRLEKLELHKKVMDVDGINFKRLWIGRDLDPDGEVRQISEKELSLLLPNGNIESDKMPTINETHTDFLIMTNNNVKNANVNEYILGCWLNAIITNPIWSNNTVVRITNNSTGIKMLINYYDGFILVMASLLTLLKMPLSGIVSSVNGTCLSDNINVVPDNFINLDSSVVDIINNHVGFNGNMREYITNNIGTVNSIRSVLIDGSVGLFRIYGFYDAS